MVISLSLATIGSASDEIVGASNAIVSRVISSFMVSSVSRKDFERCGKFEDRKREFLCIYLQYR